MIELRVQTTPAIQPEALQVRFDGSFLKKILVFGEEIVNSKLDLHCDSDGSFKILVF